MRKFMRPLLFASAIVLTMIKSYAQQVDPKGDAFFANKQYKEALEVYKTLSTTGAAGFGLSFKLGICYQNLKDLDNAISEYNKVIASNMTPPRFKTLASYNLSTAYALKNDAGSAFENLQKAIAGGGITATMIEQDTDFANIRADKRFENILKLAKDTETKRLFPCRDVPECKAFEFWLGEWSVHPTVALNSPAVGTSKVEYFAGECVMLENWYPVNGPGGKSFNFFNSQTKKWEQHWVSSTPATGGAGVTKYENGEYRDGAMRFTFQATNLDGTTSQGRFTFFNLGPDKVRQLQETSKDGVTWNVNYDLTYVRKK